MERNSKLVESFELFRTRIISMEIRNDSMNYRKPLIETARMAASRRHIEKTLHRREQCSINISIDVAYVGVEMIPVDFVVRARDYDPA